MISLSDKADLGEAVERNLLDVFTDGSFDKEARTGGWAFVVLEGDERIHVAQGAASGHSNNGLELLAVMEAMSWIERSAEGRKVILWTDSAHVVEGCHRYRAIWRNNGWKRIDPNSRARRRAIPDAALWQKLDALLNRHPSASVAWCRGHSGNAANEYADTLARQAGSAFPKLAD
jgi:ribonuclease HI